MLASHFWLQKVCSPCFLSPSFFFPSSPRVPLFWCHCNAASRQDRLGTQWPRISPRFRPGGDFSPTWTIRSCWRPRLRPRRGRTYVACSSASAHAHFGIHDDSTTKGREENGRREMEGNLSNVLSNGVGRENRRQQYIIDFFINFVYILFQGCDWQILDGTFKYMYLNIILTNSALNM